MLGKEEEAGAAFLVLLPVLLKNFLVGNMGWPTDLAAHIELMIVGALIADEEITATTILGGAIVFAGVYLGALARSDRGRD